MENPLLEALCRPVTPLFYRRIMRDQTALLTLARGDILARGVRSRSP